MIGFMRALAAIAVALFVVQPASAATIQLKLSDFLPATHGINTDFIVPWAHELERRTHGKVKVTIYPGGTEFGNVFKQLDQVRADVVDIAFGLTGIPRGRFPRTAIIDMPFLTQSADAATRALWAAFPKYLKPEYKGLKVLALLAHNGGLIHTRSKQIKTMKDLKGLRIRTPSPAISEMLRYLGATPVGMPPGRVYESLQKGVIDGTVFPWDPIASFHLAEVLKYHLDARIYTVSFYFVMNKKKYDSLPADVRKVIDDISGDNLIGKFGPWWNKWDAPGLAAAKARGNIITKLSPAERARWRKALQPMINAWLDKLEKNGITNARQIYASFQATIAKVEGK